MIAKFSFLKYLSPPQFNNISMVIFAIKAVNAFLHIYNKKRRALSGSPLPIHHLTKHHRRKRAEKRSHNRRRDYSRRIHAAVLLPAFYFLHLQ